MLEYAQPQLKRLFRDATPNDGFFFMSPVGYMYPQRLRRLCHRTPDDVLRQDAVRIGQYMKEMGCQVLWLNDLLDPDSARFQTYATNVERLPGMYSALVLVRR